MTTIDPNDPFLEGPTFAEDPEAEPPYSEDHPAPPKTDSEVSLLVHEGLAFVEPVARRVAREVGGRADFSELVSVGRAALFDAARAFDPSRCVFSAYARKRLRWAMLDAVRRDTHGRVSGARALALRSAERVADAELSAPVDASVAEQDHAARLRTTLQASVAAMAVALTRPSSAPGSDEPRADSSENPERTIDRHRFSEALREAVEALPDRQRQLVLRHYFGEERFDHIAESLGVSKSWASRLHAQAMARLAEILNGFR